VSLRALQENTEFMLMEIITEVKCYLAYQAQEIHGEAIVIGKVSCNNTAGKFMVWGQKAPDTMVWGL